MSNVSETIVADETKLTLLDQIKESLGAIFSDDKGGVMVLDLANNEHRSIANLMAEKGLGRIQTFESFRLAQEAQAEATEKLSLVANAQANAENHLRTPREAKFEPEAPKVAPAAGMRPGITVEGHRIEAPVSFTAAEDKAWIKVVGELVAKSKSERDGKIFAAAIMAVSLAICEKDLHGLSTYSM